MQQTLRNYAVTLDDSAAGSRKLSFLPYKAGLNTFAASGDWTPGAGDFHVAKAVTGSGLGAEANIGTAPTWVNGRVVIILSGTELTCRFLTIRIENAAINSDEIIVETFGHASAQYPTIYSAGGAGNMLSSGTGADQLNVSGGRGDANLLYIGGLTMASATLALKKFHVINDDAAAPAVKFVQNASGSVAFSCDSGGDDAVIFSCSTPLGAGLRLEAETGLELDGSVKDLSLVNGLWYIGGGFTPTSNDTAAAYFRRAVALVSGGLVASTTGTTTTLDTGVLAVADLYVGSILVIASGTGIGQERMITAYSSGRVATHAAWTTNPTNTSRYTLQRGRAVATDVAGAALMTAAAYTAPDNTSAAAAAASAATAATQSTAAATSAATAATQSTTAATQATAGAASAASADGKLNAAVATAATALVAMISANKFTTPALSNAPSGGSGGTSGPGADSCTLHFEDSGTTNPTADASVWLATDAAGTNVVAGTRETDSSGDVTFLLNEGDTYYVFLKKDGTNSIRGSAYVAVAD